MTAHRRSARLIPASRLQAALVVINVLLGSEASAQPPALLHSPDGFAACIISGTSSERDVANEPDADRLTVELRAPSTPTPAVVSRLAARSRDFSSLPIEVLVVPSAAPADVSSAKPRRIEPLSVEPTLVRPTIDGVVSTELFARVTYPRDVLQAGYDIVAQRTAMAENGEKVISQTRCRIREEDAAKWK